MILPPAALFIDFVWSIVGEPPFREKKTQDLIPKCRFSASYRAE
jgi:hypothetical protein